MFPWHSEVPERGDQGGPVRGKLTWKETFKAGVTRLNECYRLTVLTTLKQKNKSCSQSHVSAKCFLF